MQVELLEPYVTKELFVYKIILFGFEELIVIGLLIPQHKEPYNLLRKNINVILKIIRIINIIILIFKKICFYIPVPLTPLGSVAVLTVNSGGNIISIEV